MKNRGVTLKPGRDKAIHHKHHWIFSGAIAELPEGEEGEILPVFSHEGNMLGHGYFNRRSAIIGRMVNFDGNDPLIAIQRQIQQAILLRSHLFDPTSTNAYRLINGEGDYLPGLTVDQYGRVLVLQISTKGMERLKPLLVEELVRLLQPQAIYEKSSLPSRREEGLPDYTALIMGAFEDPICILENGFSLWVSIKEGQKTGFFLDQREMRSWVKETSRGKRVLNCFSYTGSFGVYAAAGGALSVDSVDLSSEALELAERNMTLNGYDNSHNHYHCHNVFEYLRESDLPYDLVILDPPAFAKKKKDVIQACRGYKDINRLAMKKMPPSSYLLTCSCSYHVDASLFQKVVFQAALEAGRKVRIIGRHRMASDHPVNLCHMEGGDYLKSLCLYLE
jgi:23S rRNA (cytosine1962-C5)-methyltransferase